MMNFRLQKRDANDCGYSLHPEHVYPYVKLCSVLERVFVNENHDALKLKIGMESAICY